LGQDKNKKSTLSPIYQIKFGYQQHQQKVQHQDSVTRVNVIMGYVG